MEQLYSEIEKVKSAIEIIKNKMDEIYDSDDWRLDSEKHEKTLRILYEEQSNLFKQLDILEKKLIATMPPVKSNGIIDLRYLYLDSKNVYGIYMHNTDTCVGNINYRGQHTNDFHGDIGYVVEEEYRGNGYAYQALALLGEKLYEDGISDFWVGIYDHNIASIKTVQKYGGKLIKRNGYGPYALLFQCETKKLDMENNIGRAK